MNKVEDGKVAEIVGKSLLKASIKRSKDRGKLTEQQYEMALQFIDAGDVSMGDVLQRLLEKLSGKAVN